MEMVDVGVKISLFLKHTVLERDYQMEWRMELQTRPG
jgi:hypothetical protein